MKNLIDYPDVLSVEDLQNILRIGRSAAYSLLRYIIPKKSVIDFLNIN